MPKTKIFLEILPPGCEGPTTADKGSLPLDQPGAEGDRSHSAARYHLVPESDTRGCRVGRCCWWEGRRGRDKVPGYLVIARCYYFLMFREKILPQCGLFQLSASAKIVQMPVAR
jgi:hypothetical protein